MNKLDKCIFTIYSGFIVLIGFFVGFEAAQVPKPIQMESLVLVKKIQECAFELGTEVQKSDRQNKNPLREKYGRGNSK